MSQRVATSDQKLSKGGRSPALGHAQSATASAIVIIDTEPSVGTATPPVSRTAARLAATLSPVHTGAVYVSNWWNVDLRRGSVRVRDPMLCTHGGGFLKGAPPKLFQPGIMLFCPLARSGPPGNSLPERRALAGLLSAGLVSGREDFNTVVSRLLMEASRAGVVVNVPGLDSLWGCKDRLEFALRAYTAHTGHVVSRPRTLVIPGCRVEFAIQALAPQTDAVLLKPPRGARGEGIVCARTREFRLPRLEEEDYLVQELIRDPVLIDGHKMDLRCYVAVDTARRERCRRMSVVLVRKASVKYERGRQDAEITNTAHRRRLGLPPAVCRIEEVEALPPRTREAMLQGLDRLTEELLSARFWSARYRSSRDETEGARGRVLLWGLDVLPAWRRSGIRLYLLEVNVYPQLFRGVPHADGAVEEMLQSEYLPLLDEGRGAASRAR